MKNPENAGICECSVLRIVYVKILEALCLSKPANKKSDIIEEPYCLEFIHDKKAAA